MPSVISLVISIAMLLFAILMVARKCRRVPAFRERRRLLLTLVFVWACCTIVHMYLWSATGLSYDGLNHDSEARIIARSLGRGLPTSLSEYVGNPGFRLYLALFYAVTNASPAAVYALNAFLGFFGLLAVLEAVCITNREQELPRWTILLTFGLPTALLWLPLILKEGPVVFGIGTLLKGYAQWQAGDLLIRVASRNALGFSLLFFLRPHICLAWVMAMLVGTVTHGKSVRKSIAIAVISIPLGIGALYGFQAINPSMAEEIGESGADATDAFRSHNGQAGTTAMGEGGGGLSNFLSGLNIVLFSSLSYSGTGPMWLLFGIEGTVCTIVAIYQGAKNFQFAKQFGIYISCMYAIILMAFFLGAMYNMGLAVRQRLQVVPAILVVAILPGLRNRPALPEREVSVR